jgi:uncharacterized protein YgiM (DUF1202 family)
MRHATEPSMRWLQTVVTWTALTLCAPSAIADVVVPTADVTNRVIVRASASAQSAQVGSLQPGEQLDLIGSVPNWHEVRLAIQQHLWLPGLRAGNP